MAAAKAKRVAQLFLCDDADDASANIGLILFLAVQIPDPDHRFTCLCLSQRKDGSHDGRQGAYF